MGRITIQKLLKARHFSAVKDEVTCLIFTCINIWPFHQQVYSNLMHDIYSFYVFINKYIFLVQTLVKNFMAESLEQKLFSFIALLS